MASTKFYLDCRRVKPGQPAIMKIATGHGNKTGYVSLNAKLLLEKAKLWQEYHLIEDEQISIDKLISKLKGWVK